MHDLTGDLTRRGFLQASVLAASVATIPNSVVTSDPAKTAIEAPGRKKLAVVTTAYYYLSHAYHVCGRFLYGYLQKGELHNPDFDIAAMYVEQTKENDLSGELSKKHGFKLFPDIASALTLGGDKLAVDGVILIGEH